VRHLRMFGAWHKHRYNIAASMPASCSGQGKTVELGAVLVERCVANNFVTDVEEAHGSTADGACTPKNQTGGSETGNGLRRWGVTQWHCCSWCSLVQYS
jgi:hypothetical protein